MRRRWYIQITGALVVGLVPMGFAPGTTAQAILGRSFEPDLSALVGRQFWLAIPKGELIDVCLTPSTPPPNLPPCPKAAHGKFKIVGLAKGEQGNKYFEIAIEGSDRHGFIDTAWRPVFSETDPRQSVSVAYRRTDINDLKTDKARLIGQQILVTGNFSIVGELGFLGWSRYDINPVLVDYSGMPRQHRRTLIANCNPGCRITIRGTVGKVMSSIGIVADAALNPPNK